MRRYSTIALVLAALAVGSACSDDDSPARAPSGDAGTGIDEGSLRPDYDLVFAMNKVHTVTITIAPNDFEAMQDDLADILGTSGGVPEGGIPEGGGGPPGGGIPPEAKTACEGKAATDACEVAFGGQTLQGTCQTIEGSLVCLPQGGPGGPGGPGAMDGGASTSLLSREPIYVPIQVQYEGKTWSHVGMRYKGNSSLAGSYASGNGKLAFRLDFDEFEQDHPETKDQRFHGFKKLTFASNWSDDSLLREVYVSELLRDRGIPAARCAFYRVVVDTGSGPRYWGLYTMVEDPSDGAMLASQLGGRGGNLYKPDGRGADWTVFDTAGFEKKTNVDEGDWSDVQAAVAALLADNADAATWRANLEATFDVDLFLTWLAVNTTIVNWDAYGGLAHNYYLYAAKGSKKLRWIPWDHNLSMMEGRLGGGGPTATGDAKSEIFHSNVTASWPLIRRLLDDPVYVQRYREKLQNALGGLFDPQAGPARMRELHALIEPHVVGADGELPGYTSLSSPQAFVDSIDGAQGLAAHLVKRHQRVNEGLAQ